MLVILYFISLHREMMPSLRRIAGIVFVVLNFKIDILLFQLFRSSCKFWVLFTSPLASCNYYCSHTQFTRRMVKSNIFTGEVFVSLQYS